MKSKKDKDFQELERFLERVRKYSTAGLKVVLNMGFSNKFASQAISKILKKRREKHLITA
jgi:hypothetical protein